MLLAGGSAYNVETYSGLFSFDIIGDLGAFKENNGSAIIKYEKIYHMYDRY